ncbi:tyrosyl-DNA phosphodiesterase [Pyrenophora tritici-repentis]|nr:tyrosyl-DNA phosphodiesterase [Pyrenophora tritici-repentis]PZD41043.1 tyrosyl-DNA phosphodiesterase 1 [Pyrenophora tritici-repentis]
MAQQDTAGSPSAKRRKLNANAPEKEIATTKIQTSLTKRLDRPISPPLIQRRSPEPSPSFVPTWNFDDVPKQILVSRPAQTPTGLEQLAKEKDEDKGTRFIPSPIQLTRIEKLSDHQNVDTVGLADLLGDPLIKECWNFNFLFDLDFVMQHLDRDVRDMVKVKIVHGFWKRDDANRISLLETAERYPNIELLSAYIPDPFGTHHSKMLILFRHDDTAQVVIHTANMIHRDWANMTQAVWASPQLPMLSQASQSLSDSDKTYPIGSGQRFKSDLLRYIVPENATVSSTKASTFTKRDTSVTKAPSPKFSIIFPTPEEIRNSLNGYGSGGSIHWKLQSAQQQKQLEYMHPMLCHWTSTPSASASSLTNVSKQEAHRGPAAPHIKTYIRFSDEEQKAIDWAMLTSANFSKQAWGDTVNKKEEIWIQSWETGVVVWPALFAETAKGVNEVSMVPVFGKDMPKVEDARVNTKGKEVGETRIKTTVGLRMPYDLPLKPYTADEKPWCATMAYTEPDRNGHFWPGYGR